MTEPQISGVDLARVALQAAKAAAKSRPVGTAGGRGSTRRRGRAVRGDGRDPLKLGAAITGLMTERAWEAPASAGGVVDRWADIAPELVGKVRPVHYDAASGQLDLLPVSPAFATQLRLLGRQMVARINAKTGSETVRSIRVLPPGGGPAPQTEAPRKPESAPPVEPGEVRTRETASAGYREAMAMLQAAKPDTLAGPAIRAAAERQDQALLRKREPEAAFADGQALREQLYARAAAEDDSRTRALRKARQEKAGRVALRARWGVPHDGVWSRRPDGHACALPAIRARDHTI